jgi:hypothetical protein
MALRGNYEFADRRRKASESGTAVESCSTRASMKQWISVDFGGKQTLDRFVI